MSVTQYTIGCGYDLSKLKNQVYFLNKNQNWTINIDNGEASVTFVNPSPYPPSVNRLIGFNIKFTETESLDERYKFTKQLTMSINGHLTDSEWLMEGDYYIVVQTEDGTYYLVNVDFPSKMTYTYNLSNGQNQTDFTFTSNSNHPTLKLNWNPVTWNICQTYQVFGIDGLKLLEKDYTTIDAEHGVINLFDGHEFKDVDFLKNTISLQEAYDGELTTTTISFEIPFNNYKPSWEYNLLEFDQNLYTAHITPKNSNSGIFCGYEYGLQPSYQLDGATTNGENTKITITLTESSQWGLFEFDSWFYNRDSSKKWIGIDSEVKCLGLGIGIHTLMQEVDANGTPTQRYKCLEGYENEYLDYNIIGTYTEDEAESFRTSVCTRFKTRAAAPTGYYTCINGDKYELIGEQTTYDGKHWIVDSYELGQMVESGSSWCEIEPQYKWKISDKWECVELFQRWIPSGVTCINGNKYQNNYLEVSDDNEHWRETDPLVWSASTLIESGSTDCYAERITTGTPYCEDYDRYVDVYNEYTNDSGKTWIVTATTTTLLERNSFNCGYTGVTFRWVETGEEGCEGCDLGKGVSSFIRCPKTEVTAQTAWYHVSTNETDIGYCDTTSYVPSYYDCHSQRFDSGGTDICLGDGVINAHIGNKRNNLVIPPTVENIYVDSFIGNCLVFPDSVKTIEGEGFVASSPLQSVVIGTGCTSIGDYAFYARENLKNVIMKPLVPPTLGYAAFCHSRLIDGDARIVPLDIMVFVPSESVGLYQSAWGSSFNIQAFNFN